MKKIVSVVIAISCMFSLVGCMNTNTTAYNPAPTTRYQGYQYNSPEEVALEIKGDAFSLKSKYAGDTHGQIIEDSPNKVTMYDYNSGEKFVFHKNGNEELAYSSEESTFDTRRYIQDNTTFKKENYLGY